MAAFGLLLSRVEINSKGGTEEDRRYEAKHGRHDGAKMEKGRMMGMLARTARRPWKCKGNEFDELKTVVTLRAMSVQTVKRFVRMAYENLDFTSRNIALFNTRAALAIHPPV